ncbi:hypothetical protein BDQ12DRAFT_725022 [Crucibulum laeve]|uniref:Uncharacterized protein n=1 Tax=Crucibulum laeve TaxID=68775 RepID=A0A5C3LWR5_9AGAR|nr:hypothetical protein BDQ12DRAFT_725022 [Crucibulum laeve]
MQGNSSLVASVQLLSLPLMRPTSALRSTGRARSTPRHSYCSSPTTIDAKDSRASYYESRLSYAISEIFGNAPSIPSCIFTLATPAVSNPSPNA